MQNFFDYHNHICIVSLLVFVIWLICDGNASNIPWILCELKHMQVDINGFNMYFWKLGPSLYDFL